MNEAEALTKMISPGMRRPKVWSGGVLQIHVTRGCDKACFNCTQGSNLAGKINPMTPEQFEAACASLKDYFGVVGIFGGNPCTSKYFADYCGIIAKYIPKDRRGLWSNKLFGHGKLCRETFNSAVSNLNVHLDQAAYDEMKRDWPESNPVGLTTDSRHAPPYVALQDVIADEGERWEMISRCDVNQNWSALVGLFRGELRGWFCEIAGAQAMLHQYDPNYPDLGVKVEPGWWQRPMADFADQARFHCHGCGIPLRGHGELAVGGTTEQVSKTHADIYKPKSRGREVQLVTLREELLPGATATNYIQNAKQK